ncbi:MAG TPA: hypothetical protein VIT38_00740 [Allosphingosinicella sp.]|jgi:hypothetical protein
MRSSLISALAAISLVVAPTASIAARPGGAAPLSLSQDIRAGAPVRDANQMDETGYYLIGGGVVLLLILIFVVLDDDDEDFPSSP